MVLSDTNDTSAVFGHVVVRVPVLAVRRLVRDDRRGTIAEREMQPLRLKVGEQNPSTFVELERAAAVFVDPRPYIVLLRRDVDASSFRRLRVVGAYRTTTLRPPSCGRDSSQYRPLRRP